MYFAGLQLQLDGFGGINYTLHTGNPATRPMELGITKADLTPPKLLQPHAPAFTKVSSQSMIASFTIRYSYRSRIFLITISNINLIAFLIFLCLLVKNIYFLLLFFFLILQLAYVFKTSLYISLFYYFTILFRFIRYFILHISDGILTYISISKYIKKTTV